MTEYDYSKPNWAEEEIKLLHKKYGDGNLVYFLRKNNIGNILPQTKDYGNDRFISYPDYENRNGDYLYMLIEVKSRSEFFKEKKYLGLKQRSFRHYQRVQKEENQGVRIVYLIGNKYDYELFWRELNAVLKMEYHMEMFKDYFDKREEPYYFFHSSQLDKNPENLFNPFF